MQDRRAGIPLTMQDLMARLYWDDDLIAAMTADDRYRALRHRIGRTPQWKGEHRRRAMSLVPITGIAVDPRDF